MIFTLCPNDFWHKRKIYNFDPYNVFLAIATNIPERLKTGFVVQGHIYLIQLSDLFCLTCTDESFYSCKFPNFFVILKAYQSTYKEKVVRTVFFTLRETGTGYRSFCSLILKTNTNTIQSVAGKEKACRNDFRKHISSTLCTEGNLHCINKNTL